MSDKPNPQQQPSSQPKPPPPPSPKPPTVDPAKTIRSRQDSKTINKD